jgi:tRNA(fMet)-specific endonuclease VapC
VFVLDSDLLTILQRGPESERGRLTEWLSRAKQEPVAVTIVGFEEQMRGWMAVIARSKIPRQQVPAYRRLNVLLRDYQALPVLDFDDSAADLFVELRQRNRRTGTADLKIAAVALANGAKLMTRNLRDFEGIEGLIIENPLAR